MTNPYIAPPVVLLAPLFEVTVDEAGIDDVVHLDRPTGAYALHMIGGDGYREDVAKAAAVAAGMVRERGSDAEFGALLEAAWSGAPHRYPLSIEQATRAVAAVHRWTAAHWLDHLEAHAEEQRMIVAGELAFD